MVETSLLDTFSCGLPPDTKVYIESLPGTTFEENA